MIETIRQFLEVVSVIFILYLLGYSTFQFFAVVTSTTVLHDIWQKRQLKNHLPDNYFLPVSILVPAYNEATPILGTIQSLLDLSYNIYEIIVVDDGSTDGMADVVISKFNMHQIRRPIRMRVPCNPTVSVYECNSEKVPIILIIKENGGKADALNMGINAAKYPYVVTMDADSMLESDALTNIAAPLLESDQVVAVGGLVRPANSLKIHQGHLVRPTMPKNLLACMQVLEYDRSFLSVRLLFDQYNSNLIISGAFGLFRKEELISIGGFESNTIGEDMEVVVKLHVFCRSQQRPYRIKYAPDAVCWTQVPERLSDLMRQRRRWHLGLYQTMNKYRQLVIRPGIGPAMWASYTYYLLYELLSPFVEVFGIAATVLSAMVGLVNVPFMVLFYLIYAAYGWVLSLSAFFSRVHVSGIRVTFMDSIKAMVYCLFENTILRAILLYTRLTSFVGYRKNKLFWNKIKRQKVEITYKEGEQSESVEL